MRTKSTLQKTVKFVKICKYFFSSKKNILQKNIFFLLLSLITSVSFAQSNSCSAKLMVENNGNIRSTPLDGTFYSMVLTNNGFSADTYILKVKNINSSCTNVNGSSTTDNVVINTSFIDSQKNLINEITLNPGESVKFYTRITVPIGTTVEKWSCNQITATSKNCTNYSTDTVLHTYIINPDND